MIKSNNLKRDKKRTTRGLVLIGGMIFLMILPVLLNPYLLSIMILILFYGYLGQCWNILGGYAGQLSFGHAAFFGVGAYTSSLLFVHWGVTPWVGMLVGGMMGMLLGLVIGWIAFRYGLKGAFFSLVVLAFAEMLRLVFNNIDALGSAFGIILPLKGDDPLNYQFQGKSAYYYVLLTMMLLISSIAYYIEKSKMGCYWMAIREDEQAAEALGVDIFKYKMKAIGISAFFTAIGGTFYAQYYLYIDPTLTFGVQNSIEIMIRPIIGGSGTFLGPILGAIILTPAAEITRELLKAYSGVDLIVYGIIIIIVIIYMPQGVIGWVERILEKPLRR